MDIFGNLVIAFLIIFGICGFMICGYTIANMIHEEEINELKTKYKHEQRKLLKNVQSEISNINHRYKTQLYAIEKRYNQLLIENIFDLYQASLVIRKYNIHKYQIDLEHNVVHVYCSMQVYTKMSIHKEILSNMKYHIEGTNVIL